tara:strand:- start:2274 stop:2585 length:312 start_codon:yes stop_codon:yes gene_type:complete
MGHWNFNRTYYYRGVDGFSTQDTAAAYRHICNDDPTNQALRARLEKEERTRSREPGYLLGLVARYLEHEMNIEEWSCWSDVRKRKLDVRFYELAHVILTTPNE